MTSYPTPMCYACIHLRVGEPGMTCDAFPAGIPEDILFSQTDHRQPVEGDNDIQFEQNPERPQPDFTVYGFNSPESG